MGEVSSGREASVGDPVASGTQKTLDLLSDPERRPTVPYQPLTAESRNHRAENPFTLEKARFLKNLKRARRGPAVGPSGMTADHVRPILESQRDSTTPHSCWRGHQFPVRCGMSFERDV